jgi:hypothetical protein
MQSHEQLAGQQGEALMHQLSSLESLLEKSGVHTPDVQDTLSLTALDNEVLPSLQDRNLWQFK